MDPVSSYIASHTVWKTGLEQLRTVILEFPFEEHIKWNIPVYMANGRNCLGMAAFKHHFSLWFYEGHRLQDASGVLENTQQGKTKYLRQWKFRDISEMDTEQLRKFLRETLEFADEGPQASAENRDRHTEENAPLLEDALAQSPVLRKAFEAFPLYKQKEFSSYINEARRDTTKLKRLERIKELIENGEGLNDKYRS
ncbi:DUF1801 domain-containing protein [Robertkochia flava]|uniref:DUF1801 domain-containing protein n=1 Tax=Robertkochia flava TaxID=3447986 RepID=UPI001CCEB653|nr:DUF1801 domain-containing protein [Robertkochia marina]